MPEILPALGYLLPGADDVSPITAIWRAEGGGTLPRRSNRAYSRGCDQENGGQNELLHAFYDIALPFSAAARRIFSHRSGVMDW